MVVAPAAALWPAAARWASATLAFCLSGLKPGPILEAKARARARARAKAKAKAGADSLREWQQEVEGAGGCEKFLWVVLTVAEWRGSLFADRGFGHSSQFDLLGGRMARATARSAGAETLLPSAADHAITLHATTLH